MARGTTSTEADAPPTAPHWHAWGRLLTATTILGVLALDLQRRHAPEASPLGLAGVEVLAALALLGAAYGFGSKLADLAQEHGLGSRLPRPLGYAIVVLSFVGLMSLSAGATLVTRDLVFHGVIKGKADTRSHFFGAVAVYLVLLAAFASFPGAHVDWLAVAVLVLGGTLWMWLNNRVLRLGDTLFHMFRGDTILLLGILAAIDARWLPVAVVVSSEHIAYATTKLVAMRRSWYRDGADRVPPDADRLGLAFHRSATKDPCNR